MNFVDQILLYGGQALVVSFLGVGVFKGLWRKHFFLMLYVFSVVACDAIRLVVLRIYGSHATQYANVYYGSDFCLVVFKYFAILSLFEVLLKDSPLLKTARSAFILLLVLACGISYAFVTNTTHFYRKFAVELQQNIHFAAVVLIVLMCLTLAHLRVVDPRLRLFISGFGVAAALQSSFWAIQCLVPKEAFLGSLGFMHYLVPFASWCQFALWSYALFIPSVEEAQSRAQEIEDAIEPERGLGSLIHAEVRG